MIKVQRIIGREVERMAGDHTVASNVNKDILINKLGLKQFSNTTIFKKTGYFVLSPSVQSMESLWFDLRKVNIDRYDRSKEKGYLLIRYFNKFLLADLDEFFTKLIDWDKFVQTSGSGIHWKFKIRPFLDSSYVVRSQVNRREFLIKEANVEELKRLLG